MRPGTLPSLVMSMHTVGGLPLTLQSWLNDKKTITEGNCAFLLLGELSIAVSLELLTGVDQRFC